MLKYKMIVSDFDGTLSYGENNDISKANIDAINGFVSRGGIFTVCTGRCTAGIVKILNKVGYKGYYASYNGAVIGDIQTGKEIYRNNISNEICVRFAKVIEKYPVSIHAYPNDILVTNRYNELSKWYLTFNSDLEYKVVDSVSEYLIKTGESSAKLLLLGAKEELDAVFNVAVETIPECDVIRATDIMIEITMKGTSKGSALKILAKTSNVKVSETIAVGDAGNDIPMIKAAGFGIAMGNASEVVKNNANYVCKRVEEDAIKDIIENYCI